MNHIMQLHTKLLLQNNGRIGRQGVWPRHPIHPSVHGGHGSSSLPIRFSTSDVVFHVPPSFPVFPSGKVATWVAWAGMLCIWTHVYLALRLVSGAFHECEVFLTTSRPFEEREIRPFLSTYAHVASSNTQSPCQNSAPPCPSFCVWLSNTSLNWNQ